MSEFRNGSSVNLDVVKAILVNARVCSAAAFCYSSSFFFLRLIWQYEHDKFTNNLLSC